jgi:hypothetical protein
MKVLTAFILLLLLNSPSFIIKNGFSLKGCRVRGIESYWNWGDLYWSSIFSFRSFIDFLLVNIRFPSKMSDVRLSCSCLLLEPLLIIIDSTPVGSSFSSSSELVLVFND